MPRELRQYQIEDINFLSKLPACACFNQQRTGKTPIALNYAKQRNCNKVVVICPATAVYPWKDEYISWLGRDCVVCAGTKQQKEKAIANWTDGIIISYDSLKASKSYVTKNGTEVNRDGFVSQILKQKPDCIIVDEAHRLRGRTTYVATSVFQLRSKVPNVIALTGTPAPGRFCNIWAILHLLFPKDYRGYWQWADEWCVCKTEYHYGNSHTDVRGIKPCKKQEMAKILNSFSTLRKRKDVMPWLPDKDYQAVRLPLTKEQTKYLNELENYFEIEGTEVQVAGILDRLIRYRQICLDPGLLDLKGKSPKTEWILQYLKDYPDESIIIFSRFTSYLKRLHEVIPQSNMITGDVPLKKRADICKKFQDDQVKILLINIVCGKEALTLDRGECIIFTDKYPPVGDIEQAEDRFVATTEDKANKLHKIVELMMADSYDEVVYNLLHNRAEEVDIINNYKKYLIERSRSNGSNTN